MKKPILLLLLSLSVWTGCLSYETAESSAMLSNDVDEVLVASDFFLEGNDSTAVVRITSNRSWSAHLNDLDNPIDESYPDQSVPWGRLSVEDHPNLTNAVDVVDVVVTFKRNYSKTPVRGVLNIYSDGEKKKSVNLTQAGVVYYLSAKCASLEPSDEGESVVIKVQSNNKWTAEILPGATADAILENTNGEDNGEVHLRFRENEYKEAKTLSLRLNATECEPVVINFTQSESKSDLMLMETICKIVPSGLTGYALQPRVAIEKAINLESEEDVSGVRYHYTISDVSFDAAGTPTAEDPEVPEDGIQIVPESTESKVYLTIPPHGTWYINILAEADGYRKSYEHVQVRNWQFGRYYDTMNGELYQTTASTRNFPKEYYGLTFSHQAYTRQALTNRLSVTAGNLVSVPTQFGSYAAVYLKGDTANTVGCVLTFYHDGVEIKALDFQATAAACKAETLAPQAVAPGDNLSFKVANNTIQVYNITGIEQIKYKP